jgi:arginine kinase
MTQYKDNRERLIILFMFMNFYFLKPTTKLPNMRDIVTKMRTEAPKSTVSHTVMYSKPKPETSGDDSASETMVDAATAGKIEEAFKKLQAATPDQCKSLCKKHLTPAVYEKCKGLVTPSFKSSLLDVIQSGAANLDSGVGIYAPDAEAYSVFAPLFDPVIEEYHAGFKQDQKHPNCDFGDVNSFKNLDPSGEYVVSTRVRGGRSLDGYPFNPCLTEAQYKEMEAKVTKAFAGLEGELKGTYYPLTGMTKDVQNKLIDDHFLFKEGDRFLQVNIFKNQMHCKRI